MFLIMRLTVVPFGWSERNGVSKTRELIRVIMRISPSIWMVSPTEKPVVSNTSTFVSPALAGFVRTVVRGSAVDVVRALEDDPTFVVVEISDGAGARRAGGGGGGAGTGAVKTCTNIPGAFALAFEALDSVPAASQIP